MLEDCNIAVVYLHRFGNDPLLFKAFLNSLRINGTRVDYQPFIIQKGFGGEESHPLSIQWTTSHGRKPIILHVSDEGFDLTAYRFAASKITMPYCLFFNSYSRILGQYWLETYVNAIRNLGDKAAIGATGSWTSFEDDAPFPSPHLRTTAILLRREFYLSFRNAFSSKDDCIRFESGVNGLSQSLLRSGGRIAIVGRSGAYYEPPSWPESRTYYAGDQEELLVADNRTHGYQISKPRNRMRHSTAAWGAERANITKKTKLSLWYSNWKWQQGFVVP